MELDVPTCKSKSGVCDAPKNAKKGDKIFAKCKKSSECKFAKTKECPGIVILQIY